MYDQDKLRMQARIDQANLEIAHSKQTAALSQQYVYRQVSAKDSRQTSPENGEQFFDTPVNVHGNLFAGAQMNF